MSVIGDHKRVPRAAEEFDANHWFTKVAFSNWDFFFLPLKAVPEKVSYLCRHSIYFQRAVYLQNARSIVVAWTPKKLWKYT